MVLRSGLERARAEAEGGALAASWARGIAVPRLSHDCPGRCPRCPRPGRPPGGRRLRVAAATPSRDSVTGAALTGENVNTRPAPPRGVEEGAGSWALDAGC